MVLSLQEKKKHKTLKMPEMNGNTRKHQNKQNLTRYLLPNKDFDFYMCSTSRGLGFDSHSWTECVCSELRNMGENTV